MARVVIACAGMTILTRCLALTALVACVSEPDVEEEDIEATPLLCRPEDPDCGDPPPEDDVCPTVTQSPPAATSKYSYWCDGKLTDDYGRTIPGATITLQSYWCNRNGTVLQEERTGLTASNVARIGGLMRRGNRLSCSVTVPNTPPKPRDNFVSVKSGSNGRVLTVDAKSQPQPTASRLVTGLWSGDGRMDLYQSGAYDKVLVIPEPFDSGENYLATNRDREKFWKMLQPFLAERFNAGWDVWLFQPRHTGDNLHEQAAELAQAIQYAARYQPASGCGGRVSVLGLGTAGVVARLALARWEADTAFRQNLGLDTVPPVAALGVGDSPNYGMNLNYDMLQALYGKPIADVHRTTNLDSCAAAQLLRRNLGYPPFYSPDTTGFRSFFDTGAGFTIRTASGNQTVTANCDGGPALATLNAPRGNPGWPTTPMLFGFANSQQQLFANHCNGPVGGSSPADNNAAGQNVCPYIDSLRTLPEQQFGLPHQIVAGDAFVEIAVNNAPNQYWRASAEDLVPGSRSPLLFEGIAGSGYWGPFGGVGIFYQKFSPTLIPTTSADGTATANGPRSSPFPQGNFVYSADNLVADVANPFNFVHVTQKLAQACPQ